MDHYLYLSPKCQTDRATISHLDGIPGGLSPIFVCEDPVREPKAKPGAADHGALAAWVGTWKKRGITAIPSGIYRLAWTLSPRLKRKTLRLLDVPGFDGVLIHAGNKPEDSMGCLLVGMSCTRESVLQSREALLLLEAAIVPRIEAGEHWYISIVRSA